MLCLNNITKSFTEGLEPVLKNISFELNDGDFCIIIGSNGSGKSTLMKIISGEYKPDYGEVSIGSRNLNITDRNKLIASVIQDVNKGTIPEMTLLENMVLAKITAQKPSFSFYKHREQEIIEEIKQAEINLETYIHTKLVNLSGGQRQMIATIMAITSLPSLLILDEHTSALDPKMQQHVMEYTAHNIKAKNLTAIMITHNLNDAIKYGNRLIMLHKGKKVLDLSGEEKSNLTTAELLSHFHKYEDLSLTGGEL